MTSRQTMRSDPAALDAAMDDLEAHLKSGQLAEAALELSGKDNGVNPSFLERCFRKRHGLGPGEWKPPVSAQVWLRMRARMEARRWAAWAVEIDELSGWPRVGAADLTIPAGSILSVEGNEIALCYLLNRPWEYGGATVAAVPVGDIDWKRLSKSNDDRTKVAATSLALGSLNISGLEGLTLPELQERIHSMVVVAADEPIKD